MNIYELRGSLLSLLGTVHLQAQTIAMWRGGSGPVGLPCGDPHLYLHNEQPVTLLPGVAFDALGCWESCGRAVHLGSIPLKQISTADVGCNSPRSSTGRGLADVYIQLLL